MIRHVMITLDHGLFKFNPIKNSKTMWQLLLDQNFCKQFCKRSNNQCVTTMLIGEFMKLLKYLNNSKQCPNSPICSLHFKMEPQMILLLGPTFCGIAVLCHTNIGASSMFYKNIKATILLMFLFIYISKTF